jgi:long-chain fatty acid transport protein
MKKLNLLLIALMGVVSSVFAGGLVTNTNQSAAWARTLTREATLGADAVYFNPAGLGVMDKGLHLSISNQTIFQTRQITSDYPFLTNAPESVYEAELTAPLFPSIYAAYKLEKWAFSAGFNIIGGGGSANYETGLPSFEIPVSSMVPMLQQSLAPLDQGFVDFGFPDPGFRNITGYNMSAAFEGSSFYMGFQAGVTYAINDMISVALGGRYVSAKNTYEGSLTGVTIDAPAAYGGTQKPGDYLRLVATTPGLQPETVATLNGTAAGLDVQTADAQLKATQTGSGFTPIVGVNLHFTDMLNVGIKYEHHTKIELTNETEVDDVGMFPDGAKSRADLPGMFSVGAQLKPIQKLTASVGFNYYLDKPAYYGKTDENHEQINNESTIDENAYTIAASLEYKFLGILGVSAGFSTGNLGVNDDYQSDLSYAQKSSTVAGGVFVDVGKMVTINAGYVYVMYQDYQESYTTPVPYADTYGKTTSIIAIGVDINL